MHSKSGSNSWNEQRAVRFARYRLRRTDLNARGLIQIQLPSTSAPKAV